jgi:ABC-type transport system involved in multi-copper enzyme maturation permease subunit
MGVGVSLALLYVGGGNIAHSNWSAIFLIFLELAIITAVAILFSSFSSPALSALLAFFIFLIGHFSASLRDFAANTGSSATKFFFDAIYFALPNLSFYSFITNASHGDTPPAAMLGGASLYAGVYICILLAITILIFSRRNFK